MQQKQDLYKSIGESIRQAREAKKMTQDDLAGRIGVTAATISLYESGGRKPELEKIRMIAKVLETSEVYLLGSDVSNADIDVALRSEKLTPQEVNQVKEYILLIKRAKSNG